LLRSNFKYLFFNVAWQFDSLAQVLQPARLLSPDRFIARSLFSAIVKTGIPNVTRVFHRFYVTVIYRERRSREGAAGCEDVAAAVMISLRDAASRTHPVSRNTPLLLPIREEEGQVTSHYVKTSEECFP
jgi:hypothetical protein